MNKKINVVHLVGTMNLGGAAKLVKFDVENQNKEIFKMKICCLGALGIFGEDLLKKGYPIETMGFRYSWKSMISNFFSFFRLF